jgi:carbon storage regulator
MEVHGEKARGIPLFLFAAPDDDGRSDRQMSVLRRASGCLAVVGDEVTVTVLGIKGNQVHWGINAPRNVAVHREEIFERIKREEQDEPDES